ncbi:hypothetical protein V2J09_002902 [Rumex salicifolius]
MADQISKRCYICNMLNGNKDQSLWIVCKPDNPQDDCCELPCHIDCAFNKECIGVTNSDQFRPLDANYWCISCGKVSEILECWKQQLTIAKDARLVDDLCYRLSLSHRLLDKTVRYKELHEFVTVAKEKLESELGPIGRCSSKVGRRATSRLPVARYVHKLFADAIEKADELLASKQLEPTVVYPPACRVIFEEISATSMKLVLMNIPAAKWESLQGFNVWCWRSKHEGARYEPDLSFPTFKNSVSITSLAPSSEYAIRIVSYTETGAFGITEVKCNTLTADPEQNRRPIVQATAGPENENPRQGNPNVVVMEADVSPPPPPTVEVEALNNTDDNNNNDDDALDLNEEQPIPDLNDEQTIPDLNDEPIKHSVEPSSPILGVKENIDDSVRTEKLVQENEVPIMPPPAPATNCRTLGDCILKICNLEKNGHIQEEFRLKFLTWFSLKAKEEDRDLVYTYIEALSGNPKSLAEQLVDSFGEIVLTGRNT